MSDIIPAQQQLDFGIPGESSSKVSVPASVSSSVLASSPASVPASAPASSLSSYKKMLYDGAHYARHGYTADELQKYSTVDPNDTDTQRIKKIEKGVNELNLTIKSSGSIAKVARNAMISYIVTYILFAIIIILNVSVLMKKACQTVSADSFINPFRNWTGRTKPPNQHN